MVLDPYRTLMVDYLLSDDTGHLRRDVYTVRMTLFSELTSQHWRCTKAVPHESDLLAKTIRGARCL